MKKHQQGFSAVEGLLIIVAVGLVGFVGWYVYNSKNKTNSIYNSAAQSSASAPVASKATSQRSYTLKNEKLSFKYPSSWKAEDSSSSGSDSVLLMGPNNFTVQISTGGVGHPSLDYQPNVFGFESIKLAGQAAYLDYVGGLPTQDDGLVYSAQVSMSQTDPLDVLKDKNAVDSSLASNAGGYLVVTASYTKADDTSQYIGKSLASAKSDKNYQDFKQLIASMSY